MCVCAVCVCVVLCICVCVCVCGVCVCVCVCVCILKAIPLFLSIALVRRNFTLKYDTNIPRQVVSLKMAANSTVEFHPHCFQLDSFV